MLVLKLETQLGHPLYFSHMTNKSSFELILVYFTTRLDKGRFSISFSISGNMDRNKEWNVLSYYTIV